MAEITAKLVNELRAKSGQPMMKCKEALGATDGDVEKAIEYFRKQGVKTSVLARAATEGRVAAAVSPDGKTGAIVEINCNTDFTAKSEPMAQILDIAAKLLLAEPSAAVGEDPKIKDLVTRSAQQTGENIQVGRHQVVKNPAGRVGVYQHYTGKVAVLVSFSGTATDDLIKDVCLHITAARPLALDRDSVPADLVAKEREIAIEQAKATGKPQNIAEKIAEGKMRTFYEERVLLDQKFVKDDSKSVGQLIQSAGAKLEKYVRIEVGQ